MARCCCAPRGEGAHPLAACPFEAAGRWQGGWGCIRPARRTDQLSVPCSTHARGRGAAPERLGRNSGTRPCGPCGGRGGAWGPGSCRRPPAASSPLLTLPHLPCLAAASPAARHRRRRRRRTQRPAHAPVRGPPASGRGSGRQGEMRGRAGVRVRVRAPPRHHHQQQQHAGAANAVRRPAPRALTVVALPQTTNRRHRSSIRNPPASYPPPTRPLPPTA